jgi:glycosyltransferase involved in cell wall biosynthesis
VRLVHVTTTDISLTLLLGPQLQAFAAAGYEVIGMSAPGPEVERLEALGIHHVPLRHFTRSMALHRDAAAMAEMTTSFRRLRPAIVHTHNPKPGWFGRPAARAAGVPVVVNTVHGLYAQPTDPWRRRAIVYGLERFASRFSHAELVQNPEDISTLVRLGVPPDKLTVLGNGIDLGRFDPSRFDRDVVRAEFGFTHTDVVCGAVGRLVREKGYRELFAAAAAVRAELPAFRLLIAGPSDPGKADAIGVDEQRRAEDAGVTFLGMRRDTERLYAALDLYVLASHREGYPRSAMEAAAMGLPIIATNIRGCRQVVDDGRTGVLVAVNDAAALARALLRLSGDRGLRQRMGEDAARRAADQFDQRRVISTTLEVYERLSSPAMVRAAG